MNLSSGGIGILGPRGQIKAPEASGLSRLAEEETQTQLQLGYLWSNREGLVESI
jgi:hypothetical protein